MSVFRIVEVDKTIYYAPAELSYSHIGSFAGLKGTDGNFVNNLKNVTDINHSISNEWCTIEVVKNTDTIADIYVTFGENDYGNKREVSFKLQYGSKQSDVSYTIVQLSWINGIGFAFDMSYANNSSYTIQEEFKMNLKIGIIKHSHVSGSTRFNLEVLSNFAESIPYELNWNTQNKIGHYNFAKSYQQDELMFDPGHKVVLYDEYNFTYTGSITPQILSDWIDTFISEKSSLTSYKHIISADTETTNPNFIEDTAISTSYYTRIGTVLCKFCKIGSASQHFIGYLPFICYVKKQSANNYKIIAISNRNIQCYYQKGLVKQNMCDILDVCTEAEYNDGTDIWVGSDVIDS